MRVPVFKNAPTPERVFSHQFFKSNRLLFSLLILSCIDGSILGSTSSSGSGSNTEQQNQNHVGNVKVSFPNLVATSATGETTFLNGGTFLAEGGSGKLGDLTATSLRKEEGLLKESFAESPVSSASFTEDTLLDVHLSGRVLDSPSPSSPSSSSPSSPPSTRVDSEVPLNIVDEDAPSSSSSSTSSVVSRLAQRRATSAEKKLSLLVDENRKLKSQISSLQKTIEDEGVETARRLNHAEELKLISEQRKLAEIEMEKSTKDVQAAKLAFEAADALREAAKANESAALTQLEAAQVGVQESRIRSSLLELELQKAASDAAKSAELSRQLEMQKQIADASAIQWEAIKASAEANATRMKAEAEVASSGLQKAESERRAAEALAKAESETRIAAELQASLKDSEVALKTAESLKAEAEARAAEADVGRWKAEYDSLRQRHENIEERISMESFAQEALGAINETKQLLASARETALKSRDVDVEKLKLQVELAKHDASAAAARQEAAAKELAKAEALKASSLAIAESKRLELEAATAEAQRAESAALKAKATAEDATSKLKAAEADVLARKLAAESAQAREREAAARLSIAEAEAKIKSEERMRAEAAAVEAAAISAAARANATAEMARAASASREVDIEKAHLLRIEAEVKVASESIRLVADQRALREAELKIAQEKTAYAENEWARSVQLVTIASETTAQLELSARIAAHNATQAVQYRMAKESEAVAATMAVQLEMEKAAFEAAKADVLEAEKRQLQAKAEATKALSDYEYARASAERDIERARSDREVASIRANEEARLNELREEDKFVRSREAARREIEEALSRTKEQERLKAELELLEARKGVDLEIAKERAAVEVEGRIREARENEDVHARAEELRLIADRNKTLAAVQSALDGIGRGLHLLATDYLQTVLLSIAAIAASIYGARESFVLIRNELSRALGQPVLVRETSRVAGLQGYLDSLFSFLLCGMCSITRPSSIGTWLLLWGKQTNNVALDPSELNPFADVIMNNDLEEQVRILASATRNAHANRAPLRHAMFYGPPGTGKTMVAQRLARHSKLEYAIMSGGDVAPLGPSAVSELNKLFQWAKSSPRGMILFIDEAEAFLGSRSRTAMSEDLRNVLSTLLAHTGEQSSHFMLILATNRPGDLDSAVADRVDESIFFGAPGVDERKRMAKFYFYKHISNRSQYTLPGSSFIPSSINPVPTLAQIKALETVYGTRNKKMRTRGLCNVFSSCSRQGPPRIQISNDVTTELLDQLAVDTGGFSGRQIAKLIIGIQASAYSGALAKNSISKKKQSLGGGEEGREDKERKIGQEIVHEDDEDHSQFKLSAATIQSAIQQEQRKLDQRKGTSSSSYSVVRSPNASDPASAFFASSSGGSNERED
jgi:ATPase family AAA domain-containing protein 3A/B